MDQPSTYGGPGFRPRVLSHAEDIGTVWAACGTQNEYAPIKMVLLMQPGRELQYPDPADRWLMVDKPEIEALKKEFEAMVVVYSKAHISVQIHTPKTRPPPNQIFARDLFFMTPEGAIVARPGSEQRAGEERHCADALATRGIPILRSLRANQTFEGADAIWLTPGLVAIGVGKRTNAAGAAVVAGTLAEMGVQSRIVPVPDGAQHLLGVVNVLDHNLVVVDAERVAPELDAALSEAELGRISLEPSVELRIRRGMNFVTLGPRSVLMPTGCPEIRRRLEAEGVQVRETEMKQYLKAGGAMGCATGVLRRG